MKKAVRKGASKAVALVLSLAMILGMAPMVGASAGNTADAQDNFDRIVHLDMGRKYFTPESIKTLIDEMAKLGYNQLELDFGNSEAGQLRFALSDEDMRVEYTYSVQTMVPVEDMDAQEEPAAPVETGEPVEEQPAAPVQTEEPADEEQPAETEAPAQEEPAVLTEIVEPTAPVTDEVLEQTEESGTASGATEYRYIDTPTTNTVNLKEALPDEGEYITESEMVEIITYANQNGIEIVPLLNSPGHFGAVLEAAPEYRYSEQGYGTSQSSLDVTDSEARAFGIAVVKTYAEWFKEQGCDTFNIGADEFANDIFAKESGMGFGRLQANGEYDYFVSYVNALYDMLTEELDYITVRAFNDGFYYGENPSWNFNKGFEICYWSSGWGEVYKPASAQFLQEQGHSLVNTNGDYYFVLKTDSVQCPEVDKVLSSFENESFMGGYISNPAGSMFCIWCDEPNVIVDPMDVVERASTVLPAFAYKMQGGETGTGMTYEEFITPRVTDKDTGVSAAAQGLTDIVVKSHTAKVDALESPAYQNYVAYDITLNDGEYTAAATVTIPLAGTELAGASENLLRGFVVNEDGSVKPASGTLNGTNFTFDAPHFSTVGVALLAQNTEYITVSAGDTITIENVPIADVGSVEDPGIAQVSSNINYSQGSIGDEVDWNTSLNGTYILVNEKANSNSASDVLTAEEAVSDDSYGLSLSGRHNNNASSAYAWTITPTDGGYYVQQNGKYLSIEGVGRVFMRDEPCVVRLNADSYEEHWWDWGWQTKTYYTWTISNSSDVYMNLYGNKGSFVSGYGGGVGDSNNRWDIYEATVGAAVDMDITFTGVSEGTTTVTIGDTVYNIQVKPNLNVAPLTVEYWITNGPVTGSTTQEKSIQIDAEDVYGQTGVNIAELVDATGKHGNDDVVFWKGTVLDYNNHQTGDGSDDETADGADFTYLRYWESQWQYQAENGVWTNITSSDQVVAYYLQRTEVTAEVETLTKDWGYPTNKIEAPGGTDDQVALSFAVVYPDGTMSPSENNIYDQSTVIFNWNSHWQSDENGAYARNIGIISPQNNSEYAVSKITLTYGNRDTDRYDRFPNGNSKQWSSEDTITWETARQPDGTMWYNEKVAWEKGDSAEPVVYGSRELGHYWTERNTAILVLIYLEPIVTEDSLLVNYYVDGGAEYFWQDVIQVENIAGDPEKTFVNSLMPKGDYKPGEEIALPDDAYVTNSTDVKIRIYKDLTQHLSIRQTPYGSGLYKYVRAELSDDGKTLSLYFKFSGEADYEYVIDYGLPLTVPLSDFKITNTEEITSVSVTGLKYGVARASENNTGFTYTPTAILSETENAMVTVTFTEGEPLRIPVAIYPASTVYYEAEDFVTTPQEGVWTEEGTAANRTQAADKLGDKNANNYGSDPSYKNATESSSNGAALTVTVDQKLYDTLAEKENVQETDWPYATFTFTGTGVDIISQTDSNAGVIIVKVTNTGTAESERYYVVNNYYGYSYSDGKWTPTTETNGNGINSIYQVPVISIQGLPHGNHQVQIFAVYSKLFDMHSSEEDSSYNFYLDAIRVYNPLGENGDNYYAQDSEANAQFISIHDKLVEGGSTAGTLVDGIQDANLDQFKIAGPYNEVYLAPSQSVTITVDEMSGKNVQIGARLISGSSASLTVGNGITVNSTVDQYYEVTGVTGTSITITNNSNSTVALTTLKLTGSN